MIKKIATALALMAAAFLFTFNFALAKTATDGKMYAAFDKKYNQEYYDYKKGSLKFEHARTIELSTPIKVKKGDKEYQITKVQAAVASFKTVRDYIFLKDWREYAYYAPEIDQILTEADVMNIPAIKEFEHKYSTNVSLELGPIVGMLILIFIVPLIFGFIWLKFKYNTLDFKLKNGLLEGDSPQ